MTHVLQLTVMFFAGGVMGLIAGILLTDSHKKAKQVLK